MGIGRWKRHRELDSCPESRVKRQSAAQYLGCYDKSYQTAINIALNKASGGHAGSPFAAA
jgi:hypothetical protein